jgi:cytochrome P450
MVECFQQGTFTLAVPFLSRWIGVTDASSVEHVLTRPDDYVFPPTQVEKLHDVLGNGIVVASGDDWRQQRQMLTEILSKPSFINYACDVLMDTADELGDTIQRSNGVVDVEMLRCYTFDVSTRLIYGKDFGALASHKPVPFAVAFDAAQRILRERTFNPFYVWTEEFKALFMGMARMSELVDVMDAVVYSMIAERKERMAQDKRDNVLSVLLELGHADALLLRDVTINLMHPGSNAVLHTLNKAVELLGTHPAVVNKIHKEVKDIAFNKLSPTEFYKTCKGLVYTNAVMHETMRLHPPTPLQQRMAVKDDVIQGVPVMAGDTVVWSPAYMGTLRSVWGDDVDVGVFYPERWLHVGWRRPTPFAFPVAGAGARACIGQDLATIQIVSCLSLLIQRYTITNGVLVKRAL